MDRKDGSSRIDSNDVCWILTSAFLIFTMQSGYALLESGIVSRKGEVNILIKNAVNIIFGGISFWIFGYALSFGSPSNEYIGYGDFFVQSSDDYKVMGFKYSQFMFQLAYSTTATSIISGSVSERCKFSSYLLFCTINTFVYCVPAAWIMRPNGWLNLMSGVDVGGSGTVHLIGGCSGLVAAILLGPRIGRFDSDIGNIPLGNPTNALMGLFMLWWGWLGFSAGSTFGIIGDKWKYSSKASVTTILASMGAGVVGMMSSYYLKNGLQDINILLDSILASLVAISGGAPILRPLHSIFVGAIAAILVIMTVRVINKLKIDDPTNSFAVHGVGGAWGLIAIGLFGEKDDMINYTKDKNGLLIDGDLELFKIQFYVVAIFSVWSIAVSFILLFLIKKTIGLRVTLEEELLGPDFTDHGLIHEGNFQILQMISRKTNIDHWFS